VQDENIIAWIQLILNFAVVPLVIVLFKLYNTLTDLKMSIGSLQVLLYKDFVTKEELETRFKLHRDHSHDQRN